MGGISTEKQDFKAFYFTSLVDLLSDEKLRPPVPHGENRVSKIPHSQKPSLKKYEIKLTHDDKKRIPLPVDPHFLTRKKEWGRKSLAYNSRNQIDFEKNLTLYEKDFKKAMSQLQNSKDYHTKTFNQLKDRRMQILKEREQKEMLVHAQFKYDKSPVLDSKRICVACTQRPKSAKANLHLSVDGLLRPKANPRGSQRMTFSAYEHRHLPPRPFLTSSSRASTPNSGYGSIPKIICFEDIQRPSPVGESRSATPIQLFDSSLIPDKERLE